MLSLLTHLLLGRHQGLNENKDLVKGILSDTLAEFQHRKIKDKETISQFIAVIENYRRLKNLDHELDDKVMISKIINGMTSQLNLEYKEVKRSLILHPIENLDISPKC
jgi:hypothetical protein